jgi:hypothetical protein
MTDVMAALAKDDPRLIAWEAYKATPEYQNTRNWALHEQHVDGSLWAAFLAGFDRSTNTPMSGGDVERTVAFLREEATVKRLAELLKNQREKRYQELAVAGDEVLVDTENAREILATLTSNAAVGDEVERLKLLLRSVRPYIRAGIDTGLLAEIDDASALNTQSGGDSHG